MGKSRTPKPKRRMRGSSNKYMKPGALAQMRYNRASVSNLRADLGNKQSAVLNENERDVVVLDKSPLMLSPLNFVKQNSFVGTPKTPQADEWLSESALESLPMDLLVKILCHLHHDQLKAVFHVSRRIRRAVLLARQFHFNYTTPDRSRQEMLSMITPAPTDHWPFVRDDGNAPRKPIPETPKAPKHGPRPPSRIKYPEMRQVAAVLFPESAFPSRYILPSILSRPLCKSLASNRVLFYEDELCHAVAQNKLR